MSIFQQLAAPFPADAIHWRSQQVFERNGQHSALALAYIDARDVMDRLDAVCGPHAWQDSYVETPKGRVICSIAIDDGRGWVSKSDGAGDTAVEGEKGGISDAFKRAGVKWGIGRYLYALGNVYAPCEVTKRGDKLYFKKWKPEAERIFAEALAKVSGNAVPRQEPKGDFAPAKATDADITMIQQLITATNADVGAILKAAKVQALPDMTPAQAAKVIERLQDKLADMAKSQSDAKQSLAEELGDDIPY